MPLLLPWDLGDESHLTHFVPMFEREQVDYLMRSAYNAALRAGAKIMEIYTRYDDFFVSLKADSTPITIADHEAHYIIKNYLSETRIPLLSEEGRNLYYEERSGWDLFWMVDPLDGTHEFIKRNGEFTVNIALIVDDRPFFGVIYVPTSQTMYFSDPDRGSFCKTGVEGAHFADYSIAQIFDGARKLPLSTTYNSPIRVAASRSHESNFLKDSLSDMRERFGEVQVVEHGSSLKFCLLAEGAVDFYIRTTPTFEWDTAAGEAIARGAGASIVTWQGGRMAYNKEELANPPFICHTQFIK